MGSRARAQRPQSRLKGDRCSAMAQTSVMASEVRSSTSCVITEAILRSSVSSNTPFSSEMMRSRVLRMALEALNSNLLPICSIRDGQNQRQDCRATAQGKSGSVRVQRVRILGRLSEDMTPTFGCGHLILTNGHRFSALSLAAWLQPGHVVGVGSRWLATSVMWKSAIRRCRRPSAGFARASVGARELAEDACAAGRPAGSHTGFRGVGGPAKPQAKKIAVTLGCT